MTVQVVLGLRLCLQDCLHLDPPNAVRRARAVLMNSSTGALNVARVPGFVLGGRALKAGRGCVHVRSS